MKVFTMNPELFQQLLQTTDPTVLAALMRQYGVDIDTLRVLKEYSAQFYFSEPAKALQVARLAHQVSLRLPAPAAALGCWILANALLHNSELTEAKALFEQARLAYLAVGENLEAARLSVGYVAVLAYTGQFQSGLALAAEIKPILAAVAQSDPADRRRLGSLLMNMGILYDLLGQYEESLVIYEQQMVIAGQLQDEMLTAQSCHNQAYAFVQVGAFTEALAQYAHAEAIFLSKHATADLLRTYINQGSLLMLLNRYSEARAVQEKAEQLLAGAKGMEQLRHRLTFLRTLFHLQRQTAVDDTILNALHQAQRAFAQHGPIVEEGLALILLGRCYLLLGDLTAAAQSFAAANRLVQQHGDRVLAYRVLHGLARIAHARQNFQAAIQHYEAAIQQLESIRHEIQIELYRAAFLTDKLQVYQDLAALYLEQGQWERAFAVIDRAKSRLVTEKLAARLNTEAHQAVASGDPQVQMLAQQLTILLQKLESLYQQAEAENKQHDSHTMGAVRFDTGTTVQQMEQEVQSVIHQIQRLQPRFAPLATGQITSLGQIQESLHNALFLQYHTINNQFAVFILDRAMLKQHFILANVAEVEQARHAFATAIERILSLSVQLGPARAVKYLPQLRDDVNQQLKTLHSLLIEPLLAFLPPSAPLIIAPDDTLYAIPFQALYDGQTYLVEQRAVSYAPSATLFDFCSRAQASGSGALLCGYGGQSLPAIAAELQTVARFFPEATWLVQEKATTDAFLTHAQHSRLIHLAAHATFRTDQPMLSSITLADRRLTLAEIVRQPLNADLVVLSGCETGHGQLRGADLISLASGFLGAGARSLLVSLWRVEDQATAQLMAHFYQALFAGQDRAQALRTAQLAVLQTGHIATDHHQLFTHPAFWAPFTLIGHWQSALR